MSQWSRECAAAGDIRGRTAYRGVYHRARIRATRWLMRATGALAAATRRRSPERCVDQRTLLVGSTERLQQQFCLRVRGLVARGVAGRDHHRGPVQRGRLRILRLQQLQLRGGRSLPVVIGDWLVANDFLHPRGELGGRLLLARQQAFRCRVDPGVIVGRKRFEALPVEIARLQEIQLVATIKTRCPVF
jgi:hypothetical protein